MSDYTTCEEGVTRRQAFQPCDKPAVAMRLDPEDKKPYPVCRRHCRENMVPLAEVKAKAWDRGYEAGLTDFASSMTTNPYRQGGTE